MSRGNKADRTARLVYVARLIYQSTQGITAREIAEHCETSRATAFNDLKALQETVKYPLRSVKGRWFADVSPEIRLDLTLEQAVALFISARLACRYSDERDEHLKSAFERLTQQLPRPIGRHVLDTAVAMGAKRLNPTFTRVFNTLTHAWAKGQRVRIWYGRTASDGTPLEVTERTLAPYFIEPSATGHSCYVIGLDSQSGEVRTFKLERIKDIELTNETYEIPEGWNAEDHLRSAWGVVHGEEVDVVVRFSKAAAPRVKESHWHPSQELTEQPDGSLLFKVRVTGTMEIRPWILSWGAEAEVIEPQELRSQVAEIGRRMAELYGNHAEDETNFAKVSKDLSLGLNVG